MATTSLKVLATRPDEAVKKTDLFKVRPSVLVEESGFNLRDYTDPGVIAHIESFADSYTNGRYVPPLLVRVDDNERVVVVEGHCRRRGALLAIERGADVAYLEAVQFRGNNAERVEVMLRSAEGLKLPPLAVALGYLRLLRMGHTNAMIAEAVGKTPQRVEQMLILATANVDVHDLVRSGQVTADAAIEAARQHREKAGEYLQAMLGAAKGQGKTKVTRGVMRGPSLPPKVLTTVIGSVKSVVERLDKDARRRLAEFERMDATQLQGQTITVDAAALLDLVRAQGAIDDVAAKRESAVREAEAAGAQQSLDMGDAIPQGEPEDELLVEAERIVREAKKASISMVQRKLKIGYNRAARLVEALESRGVLTAPNEAGERRLKG